MSLRRLPTWPSGILRTCCATANPSLHLRVELRCASTAAPASVVDTGFWKSLVPKPLRKENRTKLKGKSREWNPATYFIVMFLFVGSMSIQMIALRKQTEQYDRQSSVRIAQLREVVQRIQKGEDVDVDKALGTGDAQKEAEWEEILKAIERDEASQRAQRRGRQEASKGVKPTTSAPEGGNDTAAVESPPSKSKTASLASFF